MLAHAAVYTDGADDIDASAESVHRTAAVAEAYSRDRWWQHIGHWLISPINPQV